jgi:hypothetical protein
VFPVRRTSASVSSSPAAPSPASLDEYCSNVAALMASNGFLSTAVFLTLNKHLYLQTLSRHLRRVDWLLCTSQLKAVQVMPVPLGPFPQTTLKFVREVFRSQLVSLLLAPRKHPSCNFDTVVCTHL